MNARNGPDGLDLLAQQLWRRPLAEGWARVVSTGPSAGVRKADHQGWCAVERYLVLPTAAHPRLLIPAGPVSVTAAALAQYHALRQPKEAWARRALALAARGRLARFASTLSLQVRAGAESRASAELPLAVLGRALGRTDLFASVGIRPGVNGKATLQLVGGRGEPVGYAKLGWNDHTDAYVRTETEVLADLRGGAGHHRAPDVLASGEVGGHAWVVTSPLPAGVRRLSGAGGRLSPLELGSLAPMVRQGAVLDSGLWRGLESRWSALPADVTRELSAGLARIRRELLSLAPSVPIAVRWHGDLTPWNCAREPDGSLWVWDWETAEADAPTGLDALHWAVSMQRERGRRPRDLDLRAALADQRWLLQSLGLSPSSRAAVAAAYAGVVAERAASLAARAGWERSWIQREDVAALLAQGAAILQDQSS